MAVDPRWPVALFRGAVPVALGLLFWVAMAGGEQERQQTLKQAHPGEDAATLSQRRRQNELIMAVLREAAETDDNVAQRRMPWRK